MGGQNERERVFLQDNQQLQAFLESVIPHGDRGRQQAESSIERGTGSKAVRFHEAGQSLQQVL